MSKQLDFAQSLTYCDADALRLDETDVSQFDIEAASLLHDRISRWVEEDQSAYYLHDAPKSSDAAYDARIRFLRSLESKYPELDTAQSVTHRVGGSFSNDFAPVKHPSRMLSLDDVFSIEQLKRWYDGIVNDEENVGKDGETHMGIYDEAYLKSIPGANLYMPSNTQELRGLIEYSMKKGHGIVAIRYPHTLFKCKENDGASWDVKPWVKLANVKNPSEAVIAVGPKGRDLLNALKEKGYQGEMIIAVKLLPLSDDVDEIVKMDKIYVYDSYGTEAGFVETLKAALMDKGFKGLIKAFAVPNVYVQHATIAEQEEEFGLDIDSVIKQIL